MNTTRAKPRICFVQIHALGLLAPKTQVPFGGAEIRAMTFAKMLRDSEAFEISFAVLHEAARPYAGTKLQGMTLFQMAPHLFHSTKPTIDVEPIYKKMNADCFISLGANEVSHEMAVNAHNLGIPTVVGIASDQSLKDSVFQGSMILNEYKVPSFHPWEAMRRATTVLAQTQWQKDWLYRKVGKKGLFVPNPIPAGWETAQVTREPSFEFDFLWVGRPGPDKNPEILFELARDMGTATFRMIMDGGLQTIPEHWRQHLPDNVTLTDRLNSQEDMQALMSRSRVLVNTSPMEGFPNVMLQGAMVGCPSLFLSVDPDGWCHDHGCAATAHGDVDRFLALLARSRTDPAWVDDMAARALDRATRLHTPEAIKQALLEAVNQTLHEYKKERV